MDQLALAKIMMKLSALPSLPQVANRVIQLTYDPKASYDEICEVICRDQVLTSKVLKLVNSAYYGLPRKVVTITDALTILGIETLRTMVLGVSIHKALTDHKCRSVIKRKQLWRHATACAMASKLLAVRLGISESENVFIAGLLHDIGKIILSSFLSTEYSQVIDLCKQKKCSTIEAELEVLKITHSDVGMTVAEKWNLPIILAEPIGYHHDPLHKCNYPEVVQLVYLGDIIATIAGYDSGQEVGVTISSEVLDKCDLTYSQLCMIADEIKGKISIDFL